MSGPKNVKTPWSHPGKDKYLHGPPPFGITFLCPRQPFVWVRVRPPSPFLWLKNNVLCPTFLRNSLSGDTRGATPWGIFLEGKAPNREILFWARGNLFKRHPPSSLGVCYNSGPTLWGATKSLKRPT